MQLLRDLLEFRRLGRVWLGREFVRHWTWRMLRVRVWIWLSAWLMEMRREKVVEGISAGWGAMVRATLVQLAERDDLEHARDVEGVFNLMSAIAGLEGR